MTVPLTEETLRAAYAYLDTTPPFSEWNLPDADDVHFRVTKSDLYLGMYENDGSRHTIIISERKVGHTKTLMAVMAHEMVHLHQLQSGMFKKNGNHHDSVFRKLGEQVSRVHGFDPKEF